MWKIVWFNVISGSHELCESNQRTAQSMYLKLCGAKNVESVLLYDENGDCVDSWGT